MFLTLVAMVAVNSLSIVNEGGAALWPRDLEHWVTTGDQQSAATKLNISQHI
jgi:hypothetical protein